MKNTKLPKDVQEKVLGLIQQGYSANSICVAINKAYKNTDLKPADVIIMAKKNNMRLGNKDIKKGRFKRFVKAFPELWKNKETRKTIIKSGLCGLGLIAMIIVAIIFIS